jgi:hypothetical protein
MRAAAIDSYGPLDRATSGPPFQVLKWGDKLARVFFKKTIKQTRRKKKKKFFFFGGYLHLHDINSTFLPVPFWAASNLKIINWKVFFWYLILFLVALALWWMKVWWCFIYDVMKLIFCFHVHAPLGWVTSISHAFLSRPITSGYPRTTWPTPQYDPPY